MKYSNKKLNDAVKNNTGTTLRISLKIFNGFTTWIITYNKTKKKK